MASYGKHFQSIHSKITLTYSLTWQTDCCIPWRMAFKALLKHQVGFAQVFSVLIVRKNKLPEWAPTKTWLCVLSIDSQLRAWAHRWSAYAQLSPLYPSLYPYMYITHVITYPRPSTAFPYCKRCKAGRGLGTRLLVSVSAGTSLVASSKEHCTVSNLNHYNH